MCYVFKNSGKIKVFGANELDKMPEFKKVNAGLGLFI